MKENLYNNIALYTEEYVKDTTGMARVCVEILSAKKKSILYVNYDHWLNKKWLNKFGINKEPNRLGLRGLGYEFFCKFDFQKYKYIAMAKSLIISFGFLYTLLFSIWSLSYLPDLPITSLINNKVYSRTNLTREYV